MHVSKKNKSAKTNSPFFCRWSLENHLQHEIVFGRINGTKWLDQYRLCTKISYKRTCGKQDQFNTKMTDSLRIKCHCAKKVFLSPMCSSGSKLCQRDTKPNLNLMDSVRHKYSDMQVRQQQRNWKLIVIHFLYICLRFDYICEINQLFCTACYAGLRWLIHGSNRYTKICQVWKQLPINYRFLVWTAFIFFIVSIENLNQSRNWLYTMDTNSNQYHDKTFFVEILSTNLIVGLVVSSVHWYELPYFISPIHLITPMIIN